MFLHLGASLHGHEFSNRPSSNIQQSPSHLRTPLLRSAFSPPKQRARAAADGPPAPSLRQRPVSDYIPREPSPVVRFREPEDEPLPTPATLDEPVSESELSDVTAAIDGAVPARPPRARRQRRVPHKSTTYPLGYPAPTIILKTKVMQKVFQPRLLLQLQKVREDGRSQPVLEVFPASRLAGPVVAPRLAKRFPGIFGVKRHLGYDDIVLVERDDDDSNADGADSDSDESLERRTILAVYSPLKHSEEAEIVLDDGSVWVARALPNGSYDFFHTDVKGNTTTVRWARRYAGAVTPTSVSADTTASSTASAQTRDGENDSTVSFSAAADNEAAQRTVHNVDDATKRLIAVTALWVALRSGWSQSYSPCSSTPESATASTATTGQRGRSRRNTWTRSSTTDTPRSPDLTGGEPSRVSLCLKRNSLPAQPLESATAGNNRSPAATPTVSRAPTPTPSPADAHPLPLPRRATSTGTAFTRRRQQASPPAVSLSSVEKPVTGVGTGTGTGTGVNATKKCPKLLAKKEQQQQRQQRGGGDEEEADLTSVAGSGAGAADGDRDGAKKSRMRWRLARWIHKLGSSSSSSSSSSSPSPPRR
ncbi:12b74a09-cbd7-4e80-a391-60721bdb47c1 [Thermothielavioides terrestris]|uniref:12b74a09-cbd7-4e80-a391-60721bdb47c1 n=1 Tax=Thermothielavioides terrestris TaxID=2587410 RepID=A0A3S4AVH0_9PEZI|nr:12b74a09-cbd7-4e80-a391-60721bdb47c1 [Thermothielavioides terrestris]